MLDDLPSGQEYRASAPISTIESVMQPHAGSYPMPKYSSQACVALAPILTEAFLSQPLLGNVILSSDQREKLHTMAVGALSGALTRTHLKEYGLTDFYCDILVLETTLLLRNWNDNGDDNDAEGEDEKFWEYICNQYALPYDDRFGNGPVYKVFRTAISKSLKQHNRLFLKEGQRYYTTMLTHAIAPKKKFFALFEQIFAFYAETLNYQYTKGDPAFRAFSNAMKVRFESGRVQSEDDVYIKSVQSSSAIRALFLHCTEYMASAVEKIVSAIDSLVATGGMQDVTYIDSLLKSWYEARTRDIRTNARRARSKAGLDRVVTEYANIRPIYRYENGRVWLIIPPIRLGEKVDNLPHLTIFRSPGDKDPYTEWMGYYGDYFCITSAKKPIPMDELLSEDATRMEPRVIISYGGKDLYDSGSRLYRNALTFGDGGGEITKRPDGEYANVFIARHGDMQGEESSPDCTASLCGKGLMYRILIDDTTLIRVDGVNLFPIERVISGLTLSVSVAPISHCTYLIDQRECRIFTKQTTLTLQPESQTFAKQCRLLIDETLHPLVEHGDPSALAFHFLLPDGPGMHEVQLIDNITQRQMYLLNYVLMEAFSLRFDGFYYFDHFCGNGGLEISDHGGGKYYPYEIIPEQDAMIVPYRDGDLSIDIPALRCCLNGEVLHSDEGQMVWYDDIKMFAVLELTAPRGYSGTVFVGQRPFPSPRVELGNVLRIGTHASTESVGVMLRKGDESADPPIQIKLFDVAFEPQFKSPPLLAEGGHLLWCAEGNYVGGKETEFEILLSDGSLEPMRFRAGCEDKIITLDEPLENGIYDYVISSKAPGFFTKYEPFTRGQFLSGSPALFKFHGRAMIVTEAIMEHERFALTESSGIITQLHYIGEHGLNGETQPYPCYEGYLQYKKDGTLYPYAAKEYERNGIYREQVNPIKVWIINDYTISLRSPLDDGLYVNTRWNSITDRPPPTRAIGDANYCNPDYYSFKLITLSEVEHV